MTDTFTTPEQDARPTVTATAGGITMTVDLHQMLTAIDPAGRWVGYDPDEDDDVYEPSSLALQIAESTSRHLVKQMRKEVLDLITVQTADTIRDEVTTLVRDALVNGTLQRTTEWGRPQGEAKPLQDVILETATEHLTKPTGDSYGRGNRQTLVQKIISDAVTAGFKKEVAGVVEQARAAALQAVQDSAAEVIKETVVRASRGL